MKEQIDAACLKLKLSTIRHEWQNAADEAAKNNVPYSTFLCSLLDTELSAQYARRTDTLRKFAKFPFHKTIDEFHFEAQPSLDERRIRECLTLSFLDRRENIIFLGPPGVGKTHLAVSIGMEAISKGYKTYFISAHDLVSQLRKADHEHKLERKLSSFVKPSLLIIDEMGYLELNTKGAHYLFQVVSRRYERGSMILTSNKSFSDWGDVLGDPVIATATLDRLLHHAHIFNLDGESYRMKDQRG